MKINSTKLGMITFAVLLLTSMVPLYGTSASSPQLDLVEQKVLIWAHNSPFGAENSPFWSTSVYSGDYIASMYAGLMRRTIASDQAFVPDLAAAMPTVSSDSLVWTFTLQTGLTFSDGTALNASAVKFSYTMFLTSSIYTRASGLFPYLNNASIVVTGDLTVQFTLLQPYAFAPGLFSSAILSPDVVTGYGGEWLDCTVGTEVTDEDTEITTRTGAKECVVNAIDGSDLKGESGPFMVESYSAPNSFISLIPNPNYYMADQIKLDRLIIRAIEESTAAQAALAAGEINIFDSNYNAKVDELSDIPGLTESIIGAPVWQEMYPNHNHPYFGQGNYTTTSRTDYTATGNYTAARMIRMAITHMVDRDYAANEIAGGLGTPAALPIPQIVAGFDDTLEPRTYNLALAREYMTKAGFDYSGKTFDTNDVMDGTPFFTISLISPTGNVDREQWAARMELEFPKLGIGVDTHLKVPFGAALFERTFDYIGDPPTYAQGGFDISFIGWSASIDYDPFGAYDAASTPGAGSCCNVQSWINATMETQMTAYVSELDTPTRLVEFKVLQGMIYYNEIVFPILYEQAHWAWADNIVGMAASSLDSRNFEWENVDINLAGPVTVTDTETNTATETDTETKTEDTPVSIMTIFFGMSFAALVAIYRRKN